ncbi:hypothetical protein LHA01_10400 [Schleiferilactobacillus harbinensis]|nr:hypothetical protein LHA01_10400 [Schleiferilactobacillus harbinensis]
MSQIGGAAINKTATNQFAAFFIAIAPLLKMCVERHVSTVEVSNELFIFRSHF